MLFPELPDSSKVWLYQSNRQVSNEEVQSISLELQRFISQWNSHGEKLNAAAKFLNPFFIAFVVDESQLLASGCSIDKSVKFIQDIQVEYNIDFFNRMLLTIVSENGIKQYEIADLKKNKNLKDIVFFDPLIQNLGELRTNWIKKIIDSNYSRLFI